MTGMKRRTVLGVLGLVAAGLLVPAGIAAASPAKEATVTLEITGMT